MDGRTIPSYYALVTKKRFAPPKSNFVQVVTGQTLLASLDSWNWFALPAARSESMTKESMTTPTRQFKERMARSVLNARILKSLMEANLLTPIEAVQAHILIQKALEATEAERAKRDRAMVERLDGVEERVNTMFFDLMSGKTDFPQGGSIFLTLRALCINTLHFTAEELRKEKAAALKEQETER